MGMPSLEGFELKVKTKKESLSRKITTELYESQKDQIIEVLKNGGALTTIIEQYMEVPILTEYRQSLKRRAKIPGSPDSLKDPEKAKAIEKKFAKYKDKDGKTILKEKNDNGKEILTAMLVPSFDANILRDLLVEDGKIKVIEKVEQYKKPTKNGKTTFVSKTIEVL